MLGLQKFWQGGTVRLYSWDKMQQTSLYTANEDNAPDFDMDNGMISIIKGRTNAGHLGHSISIFGNEQEEKGIWIGEPMSERGTTDIPSIFCSSTNPLL